MNPQYNAAMVAPAKPAACVGYLGRRCTCGLWHATGGVTVESGMEFDHKEMPVTMEEPEGGAGLVLAILGGGFFLVFAVGAALAIYFR